MILKISSKSKKIILALGPESAGNFSVYQNGTIYLSDNLGDLLDEKNFIQFRKAVQEYLKKHKLRPNLVIYDLHPLYKTTEWGGMLAKKFGAEILLVQHHVAHVFSAIGERLIDNPKSQLENVLGIACDGTGFGEDGKVWGGEVFRISNFKFLISNQIQNPKSKIQNIKIERVGHLDNQTMIGGELAIREPARMLMGVLGKFLVKAEVFEFVKKYYTRKEFDLFWAQSEQKFNCIETSSAGRVLDAVSLLLGFCGNERKYKHEPIDLLEKNSGKAYVLAPSIKKKEGIFILETRPLFEYLVKNMHKDKGRLAATAQLYLARGLYEIVERIMLEMKNKKVAVFAAGGVMNTKIISSYLEGREVLVNKKIPRGDAGLSFGQLMFGLANSWD